MKKQISKCTSPPLLPFPFNIYSRCIARYSRFDNGKVGLMVEIPGLLLINCRFLDQYSIFLLKSRVIDRSSRFCNGESQFISNKTRFSSDYQLKNFIGGINGRLACHKRVSI